jgi:hypothetical protein
MSVRRIVGAVLDTLSVVVALPLFVVFTLISPLLKPRGDIVYPRYRCVNGIWCKTFLSDDMANQPPEPISQPQSRLSGAPRVPANSSR